MEKLGHRKIKSLAQSYQASRRQRRSWALELGLLLAVYHCLTEDRTHVQKDLTKEIQEQVLGFYGIIGTEKSNFLPPVFWLENIFPGKCFDVVLFGKQIKQEKAKKKLVSSDFFFSSKLIGA
jgi:hypothetical protein